MEPRQFQNSELSTILTRKSAKRSKSDKKRCGCGNIIEPVEGVKLPNGDSIYPYRCRECHRRELELQRLEEIRRNRMFLVSGRRAKIKDIIPPLFRYARIGHVAESLRDRLLNLPGHKGVFLWGPVGTGKSYSLCALARHLVIQGYMVERVKWDQLCLDIRGCYKENVSEQTVIKPLIESDILIIEDLGSSVSLGSKEKDFAVRTLLLILDARLENCKPTLISSNKPVEEIEKSFDQRVGSRLEGMCEVVKVAGDDKRRLKR